VSESNAHGHDDTDLRLRSCIQITLFGVASVGHLGNQIAVHIDSSLFVVSRDSGKVAASPLFPGGFVTHHAR
jgi:hypothetical protein